MAILRKPNRDARSRNLLRRFGFRKSSLLRESAVEGVVSEAIETIQRQDRNVRYIVIDSASPYVVALSDLIDGETVFGVKTLGPMTVQIPLGAREQSLISIADERGKGDTDRITVQVV